MTKRTARTSGKPSGILYSPSVSVIVPAFNEAGYLPETLKRLHLAEDHFKANVDGAVEIVVVDNASTDRTVEVAQSARARVVHQQEHNVAKVRNTGASAALYDFLIFLDADTLVPPELLLVIAREMTELACMGGAVDGVHQPSSLVLRVYLRCWRIIGLLTGMAQGSCQFCRKSVFEELHGYDETMYMGEDVDFYWRLKRLARRHGSRTTFIREIQVEPSPRRWESWPVWRTLIWTNPVLAFGLRRRKAIWAGWYKQPPR